MQPTPGRIVMYRLSQADVDTIAARRQRLADVLELHRSSIGNPLAAGDEFPAVVVRVWGPTGPIQLQVLLDGMDTHWASSVAEGEGERQWSWPPRVG